MEKAHILVVEDEAVVAMDIGSCLRHLGHPDPTITTTGEDALTKTAQMHPDLVLMDITLQGKMDGFEAAAQIRDSYHVPVIYLTGNSDETTILRAAQGNPSGYLLKPFHERGLGSSIEMALQRHRMDQGLQHGAV
jgi:CheY-like chemotaxis protein